MWHRTHIVTRCHRLTVGACRTDGDEVAAPGGGKEAVMGEYVAGLAHGTYYVEGLLDRVALGCQVLYLVACVIQCWSHQVVHSGVQDDEAFGASLFHVGHTCNQGATLSDNRPAQLKVEPLARCELKPLPEDVEILLEVRNGLSIRLIIADAQAAAHVDVFEMDTIVFIFVNQLVDGDAQHPEGLHVGDLGTDVEMQASQVDVGQGDSLL